MARFFTRQYTPNPKKNFFQNYSDHLKYLNEKFSRSWNKIVKAESVDEQLALIGHEAFKRLNLFERLRDRYDYMDEIVGATAIPAMSLVASVAALAIAVWQSAQELALITGLAEEHDRKGHLALAGDALFVSAAAFVFAAASFLKSAISLVTRPVVTALEGYEKQDIKRFYDNNSVASGLMNTFLSSVVI